MNAANLRPAQVSPPRLVASVSTRWMNRRSASACTSFPHASSWSFVVSTKKSVRPVGLDAEADDLREARAEPLRLVPRILLEFFLLLAVEVRRGLRDVLRGDPVPLSRPAAAREG